MIYGYARVSTNDQNIDRQLDAFNSIGVENIFADKMSGKNFERTQYQCLKKSLKNGDILYIKSIDRLGRNYDMIIDEWRDITHNIGADIVVLDMPLLDTRDKDKGLTGKFISDLVLQILSYVAETERNNIKQRQAEGIRIAKEKGKHLGRPKTRLNDNFKKIVEKWHKNEITIKEALQQTNMKRSNFFKQVKELGFSKYNTDCKYHVIGEYIDKSYDNKSLLLEDLKVSVQTLNSYFKGKKTIINKLGLTVEKI